MNFDYNSFLHLITDTAWLDRMVRKVGGAVPDWVHLDSSVVAIYVIMAAIIAMALINAVLTLEYFSSYNVRRRYSPIGKALLFICDGGLAYVIYQIVTP